MLATATSASFRIAMNQLIVEPNLTQSESVSQRPSFTIEQASELARTHFALEGSIEALPGERDQNFHISGESGKQWVFKIVNADAELEPLECQNQAMRWVAERVGVEACPVPLKDSLGNPLPLVTDKERSHRIRAVPFLPGIPLAEVRPHHAFLRRRIGLLLGRVATELQGFDHPAADRRFRWDLAVAEQVIGECRDALEEEQYRRLQPILEAYAATVAPVASQLRRSVIHGDANDYNVIVDVDDSGTLQNVALIDFGDLVKSHTVNEIAIAAAYVCLGQTDPLAAICDVVQGFHESCPLEPLEWQVLYPLICMRLAVSVSLSQLQSKENDDPYLTITEQGAWVAIDALTAIDPDFATARIRHACGLCAAENALRVTEWLARHQSSLQSMFDQPLSELGFAEIDLSIDSDQFSVDMLMETSSEAWQRAIDMLIDSQGKRFAIGGYNEARLCYQGEQFKTRGTQASRTVHIGLDVFGAAGTEVHAPLRGRVVGCCDNALPFDYGPTIILEHQPAADVRFYSLYGHLDRDSLDGVKVGDIIEGGGLIGRFGAIEENGGWPPHLHLQLICDMFGNEGDFPGVAPADLREFWLEVCPDPSPLLGLSTQLAKQDETACIEDDLLQRRRRSLGPSLSLSYRQPLHIVRGVGQYLFDDAGRSYLDAVNNVCHVGHSHPRVVEAAAKQWTKLNTNTRYLHENLVRYAERLSSTLPAKLEVCFFVNSGSEANDLAMRLVRAATGRDEWLVIDTAYHGNLHSLIGLSPYKHNGWGGQGPPANVHAVEMPDSYRGRYRAPAASLGEQYAKSVSNVLADLEVSKRPVAGFFAESILSCGGQIVLPDGYLQQVYDMIRASGGICVADEVQVGFGRIGSHFWGFELQGVVPDIVTMGKPIGNGHPLAAVVTTREIADAFANGMEYFNTFGGNPVSAAIGLAVLDVIEEQNLQQHASVVGEYLKSALKELQARHPNVGDVRGEGLFLGVELVVDAESRTPDAVTASYCAEQMLRAGILMSTDGPDHNVLKIKPPLVFDQNDADRLVAALDEALSHQLRFERA